MTTFGDLVDRTLEGWLEPNRRHSMSKLSAAIGVSDVALTLSYPLSVSRGTRLSLDDEDILVWAYDTKSSQVTDMTRGYGLTDASAHNPGTIVEMDSRFPRGRVLRALREEVNSWGTDIYGIEIFDLMASTNMSWLDLAGFTGDANSLLGIVDARIRRSGVDVAMNPSTYDRWPRLDHVALHRNMPTDQFPSGIAIKLGEISQGVSAVRVHMATSFNASSATETTDVTVTGLIEPQCEVACVGAAVRLMYGMEQDRSDRTSAGEARRAQETQVGQTASQASLLQRAYDRRLDLEKARLTSLYPIRVT